MNEVINKDFLWTEYDISSNEQVKNVIRNNINQMYNSWTSIGFALKQARDKAFYKEDGYKSIQDYAYCEFGIKKQRASRLITIVETLSVNGNSPVLEDKWKDFSISKLEEIIYLDEEDRELAQPIMTTVQIRNIGKKDEVKEVSTSKQEPEVGLEITEEDTPKLDCLNDEEGWHKEQIQESSSSGKCIHRSTYNCTLPETAKITTLDGENCSASCCWECIKHGECKIECNSSAHRPEGDDKPSILEHNEKKKLDIPTFELNGKAYGATRSTIIESLVAEMVEMELSIADIDGICCHALGFNYYAYNMGTGYITIENEDEESVFSTSVERFKGEYEWHKVRLATLSLEESKEDEKPESVNDTAEIVNDVPENVTDSIGTVIASDQDETEIIEADVIQTVLESEFTDQCTESGLIFNSWLKANNTSIAQIVDDVLYNIPLVSDKDPFLSSKVSNGLISALITKTEAYYSYLTKELGIESEHPKPVQPELPVLKNNDQRKEWAENYKAWGEWYYDKNIDCHYYKYDFPNGDRLVVEEYRDREVYWNADKRDEKYYHLLRKEKKSYGNKHIYEEKFIHQTTSMSEIVEYLKAIRKKGA